MAYGNVDGNKGRRILSINIWVISSLSPNEDNAHRYQLATESVLIIPNRLIERRGQFKHLESGFVDGRPRLRRPF